MFNQFIVFVNTNKCAQVVSSVSSAHAALGAPPPDVSFFPHYVSRTQSGVEGSVFDPLLYFPFPTYGISRRLVALP